MAKLNNSNMELLGDIIETLDFSYNPSEQERINCLGEIWEEISGGKLSKMSRIIGFTKNSVVVVSCADSFIANELYLEKDKLFNNMKEKAEKLGIKIEGIKFDYKNWKETDNGKEI